MMKKVFLIAATALAFLFISCGTTGALKSDAYPEMYGEKAPVSILVMPPINETSNVDAKDFFYYTLNQALADKGYYVFPSILAMQTLQQESAYDSEMFVDGDIHKFGTTFGADLLLFTTITKWEKSAIGSQVTIEIDYKLRSTSTGNTVYERKCTFICDTSQKVMSGGGGYAALFALAANVVASAVSTATTDYVLVARNCTYYTLDDLPAGKYYEAKAGLDGGEAAGAPAVVYRVQKNQLTR